MRTPLRYPGGKSKFSPIFSEFIRKEGIKDAVFVEPFCGGAGAAINLLLNGEVRDIYLNDIDKGVYAFWHTVLRNPERMIKKIQGTDITLREFDKQHLVQEKTETANLFTLGFSTFFLNRTAYSGVITAGPIGGREQSSRYKVDCRFNKENLIKRIRLIAEKREHVHIFNEDAENFLKLPAIQKLPKSRTVFYVDPPYFEKGVYLYKSKYRLEDHENLERTLRDMDSHIFVSYDDCEEIRGIYASWDSRSMTVPHFAGKYKRGKEIMFRKVAGSGKQGRARKKTWHD